VAREEAKEARQVTASGLAAARAQKRAEVAAAKAQKATNLSTNGLSIAPQKSMARPKPKRGASQLEGGEDHGEGPSEPAPKASRTRTIRATKRYFNVRPCVTGHPAWRDTTDTPQHNKRNKGLEGYILSE
jgi:hypothetical protein